MNNEIAEFGYSDKTNIAEVVRCADCTHYNIRHGICNLLSKKPDQYHTGYSLQMDDDDFCSYGKKKG